MVHINCIISTFITMGEVDAFPFRIINIGQGPDVTLGTDQVWQCHTMTKKQKASSQDSTLWAWIFWETLMYRLVFGPITVAIMVFVLRSCNYATVALNNWSSVQSSSWLSVWQLGGLSHVIINCSAIKRMITTRSKQSGHTYALLFYYNQGAMDTVAVSHSSGRNAGR